MRSRYHSTTGFRQHVRRTCVTLALLLSATAFPVSPLRAQEIVYGIKAGASQADLLTVNRRTRDMSAPWDSRTDATVGVTVAIGARRLAALQLEALFARKGWRHVQSASELRLDYVEMPILLRLAPTRARDITPVMLLGVAPSAELSCGGRSRPPTIGFGPAPLQPIDCNEQRQRRYDVGLVGAVGADVSLGSVALTTELRYTHGVRDLSPASPFAEVRHRSMSVLVGVRSNLAR